MMVSPMHAPAATEAHVDAVLAGDIRMAARMITQVESGDPSVRGSLQKLWRHGGHTRVVGVTGPPGAGKSTLVDQLIDHWRDKGERVAVLAVDPSSPFTGGALLGDRLRMARHCADPGVFIRSMGTRGVLGGLSKAVGDTLTVLDAMKWDWIIVETVGVGQSEMNIVKHTSCVVLLQTAMGGDAIQASKSGVLEVGDIFVVNKADAPGSRHMVAALNEMIGSRADHGCTGKWQPRVTETEATLGKGIAGLSAEIERRFFFLAEHPAESAAKRSQQIRERAVEIAVETLNKRLQRMNGNEHSALLLEKVLAREQDPYDLAAALLTGHR